MKYVNELCEEYQRILKMSDEAVMAEYGEFKADIVRAYEEEIDWWENRMYNR